MKYPHLTSSDARKILRNIKPEHSFKLHSGSDMSEMQGISEHAQKYRIFDIQNLRGLAEALKLMPDSAFRHHVTREKNDFSNWVMDVVGDEELADSIRSVHDREKLRKKVEERVKFLGQISSEHGVSALFMRRTLLDFLVGFLAGLLAGYLIFRLL